MKKEKKMVKIWLACVSWSGSVELECADFEETPKTYRRLDGIHRILHRGKSYVGYNNSTAWSMSRDEALRLLMARQERAVEVATSALAEANRKLAAVVKEMEAEL